MIERIAQFKSGPALIFASLLMLVLAACDSPEEKAKSHYESGMAFVEKENFIKAGIEFRNALQLKENYADAWYGLALVEESEGNLRLYAGDILKAIELDPKHVKAQSRYGKIMLLSGRLEDALKTSDLVMELDPNSADSLALKAAVLFRLDDKPGAVAAATAALKIDPSNIDAVTVLAAERLDAKEPAGAVTIIDEGLLHRPGSTPLQIVKMRALTALDDDEGIISVFQELIAENPESKEYRQGLSSFLESKNRFAEAETVLRGIATDNPEDIDAKLDVVKFIRTTKDDSAAVAELEGLIAEYPEVFRYRFALAELWARMGDEDKSQAILQSIIDNAKVAEDALIARNRVARTYLTKGDLAQARILVDEVLATDAQNAQALVMRAAMQIDEGNIEDAISNLRSSLKQNPDTVNTSILLAKAHEINGAFELAEDRLAAAYRYSKQAPEVGLAYVQFFLRQSAPERAEDLLQKMIARNPRNTDVLKAMAQLQLRKQNWGAAEELADRIKEIDATDVIGLQISGAAAAGLQKADDSEQEFEKAYESTPDSGQTMLSLVQSYLRNGKVDKAESFLNSVLERSEDNYLAKMLLAQIALGKGEREKAETEFLDLIKNDPDRPEGYMMLTRYYLASNQQNEAQDVLTAGLAALPDNFTMNLTQAGLFEANGEADNAIAIYEKLLVTRPNSEIVVNNLASLIAEGAEDEESLRRAYALAKRFRNTKVPFFKDTLGWIHYRLGEYEMATPLIKEAAEALPNMAIVRYHLGLAHKAENNFNEAEKELEAALKLAEQQNFSQVEEAKLALEEVRAAKAN
ncbi:tetratricopeptide repeat protein [Sneathiella marina]|uniref:Tetratricopeptide repeat protein n=1 Tax=Sneathiella marina TaxID=2950108 RepID=A0ABY4W288_9PROT|nr:tetratricopeptide repeat protein [Sneathiella marina]USG61302.1 tetratricopeptide repeat protein [Sneathiella marina]